MRLSAKQTNLIIETVRNELGEALSFLGLYGSRLDDDRRGGDVDLFVEVNTPFPILRRAALKMALEDGLGLPVDLLVTDKAALRSPFQRLAREQAVNLGSAA